MEEYITPTPENPVFRCLNDYFGYIEEYFYKQYEVKKSTTWCVGCTFATSLTDAIVRLHEYIKEYPDTNPQSKFMIEMIDGSVDRHGDPVYKVVYKISMKQAKQYKLI